MRDLLIGGTPDRETVRRPASCPATLQRYVFGSSSAAYGGAVRWRRPVDYTFENRRLVVA